MDENTTIPTKDYDNLITKWAQLGDLMEAIDGLWAYMEEKYPGEPLRCPHMIAIREKYDAAKEPI